MRPETISTKKVKAKKQFECKICSKAFDNIKDHRRHELTHSGLKSFQCKTCGKCFGQPTYLKSHEKNPYWDKTL